MAQSSCTIPLPPSWPDHVKSAFLQALGSTEVPYPSGASGDPRVILEVVVEVDGSVSQVEVIEGSEPLAEQARRAALGWQFEAARRGDVAVTSRVWALVEFRQEVPEKTEVGAVTPGVSPPAQPSAGTASEPLEVIVQARRRDIGQTTVSAAEVRELPGALGDPFRAIEALPGVTPAASGIPYFFIRGAPPNNNGLLPP